MWCRKLICSAPRSGIQVYKQNIIRTSSQTVTANDSSQEILFSDKKFFNVGQQLHGFEVKAVRDITEFKIIAVLLEHQKTKSEYLHLFRNDNNNVFSINFRTTPMNSTGLPHVLEHLVLTGSKKYPVRDPFFKMIDRTLATFMNALTGSDFTMYPFSTQNLTDYMNIQKVYLDAVFHPNLKELDFLQEGWRLENAEIQNIDSPLTIKGVVYNEMKGVFSENDNLLSQKLVNTLLPDHTYGYISGGDPLKIPDLTWQDLKAFHKTFYHPSNAKFYSYGNFPLAPTLEFLDREYLSSYSQESTEHTSVPKQNKWTTPKREHVEGRYEQMRDRIEKQNYITISTAVADITNVYDTFLMVFLSELLLKGPNAPFYKNMIEPNFSGGFTPSTGYDPQTRDGIFTVGLQGIRNSDFDKVIKLYDKTIDDVIALGFDKRHIESVLHRYELSIKHETSNFGLNLLFGMISTWTHNGDVLQAIEVNKSIAKLKNEIKNDPKYLQTVVLMKIKDNKHKLILTMSPDKNYEEKQLTLEKSLIRDKTNKLGQDDKKEIYEKNLELLKEQASIQQNTDLLPTLTIDDVNTECEKVPINRVMVGSVPTQINKVQTNGIVYFKGVLNSVHLSQEQQMLLPLFCYVVNKLGTDKLDYKDFDTLVQRKTAGLDFNVFIGESLHQLHTYEPGVTISSYCLEKNVKDMWDLWSQLLNLTYLKDVSRFKMLVQLYMSNLTQGIVDSGHLYAMLAASSLVSGSAYQKELLTGLQHIAYMKRLMHVSNYPAMLREISAIGQALFNTQNLRCSLTIPEEKIKTVLPTYKHFISQLPQNSSKTSEKNYAIGKVWAPSDAVHCQHHIINIPVHFCSKAVLTAPYTENDYAKLRVLARLLSSKYLHVELREKNGAYDGGAKLSPDGIFSFFSYRDPRNLQTLDAFDKSQDWIVNELDKINPQEIAESKLGVFRSIDMPVPPSGKGQDEFLLRLTPEILDRHRHEVMTTDLKSLKDVSEKYLFKESAALCGKVILGPKNEWDTSSRSDELWTFVENV